MATVAPGITSAFKTGRKEKGITRHICHVLSGQQKFIQSLASSPPAAYIHLLNINLKFCSIISIYKGSWESDWLTFQDSIVETEREKVIGMGVGSINLCVFHKKSDQLFLSFR